MSRLKTVIVLMALAAFLAMLLFSNGCEWGGT